MDGCLQDAVELPCFTRGVPGYEMGEIPSLGRLFARVGFELLFNQFCIMVTRVQYDAVLQGKRLAGSQYQRPIFALGPFVKGFEAKRVGREKPVGSHVPM